MWYPLNLIVDNAIPPRPFNEKQVMNEPKLYGYLPPDSIMKNLYNRSSGNLIHHKLKVSNKFDGMRVSVSTAYRNTRTLRPSSGSHIGLNATCKQGQTLIKWVQLIRGLLFQQGSVCTYTLVQLIQVGQEIVQSIARKRSGEVRNWLEWV